MTERERKRFDAILERVLEDLPERVRELLDELPVVVEDQPSARVLEEMSREAGEPIAPDEICGLHTGTANTERHVDGAPESPSEVYLFRVGILAEAGGWEREGESPEEADEAVYEEIRITLLHEIGHQFGLDEDDLDRLGYQ